MDYNISESASTIQSLHYNLAQLSIQRAEGVSAPSSPHSSALPSPPDSPSSVSSFPSVSSSFFFSSAAASPPHSHPHSDHGRESTQGLIIPSLTLPSAFRQPTPYGQTLGDLRLLVLGKKDAGKSFVSALLLEENEDVVEVGQWEDGEYGRALRVSTDWIEHRDAHGLEKFEPTRNVEIVDLPGYDHDTDAHELLRIVKAVIQTPFYTVSDVLDPKHRPSAIVANLVSSSSTPLYTALIFLLSTSLTPLDQQIIENLGTQIPVIVLPRLSNHVRPSTASKLSSFRPSSPIALRTGLFHSPETIATLRGEAADRFLRWREVERAVDDIHMSRRHESVTHPRGSAWDKAQWESELMSNLSHDVAKRLREGTITERDFRCAAGGAYEGYDCEDHSTSSTGQPLYDPLHFPSIFVFLLSLLGPLQSRLVKSVGVFIDSLGKGEVKAALLGGFCVGLGIGLSMKGAP